MIFMIKLNLKSTEYAHALHLWLETDKSKLEIKRKAQFDCMAYKTEMKQEKELSLSTNPRISSLLSLSSNQKKTDIHRYHQIEYTEIKLTILSYKEMEELDYNSKSLACT